MDAERFCANFLQLPGYEDPIDVSAVVESPFTDLDSVRTNIDLIAEWHGIEGSISDLAY